MGNGKIYLPFVTSSEGSTQPGPTPNPGGSQRLVIDPLTRIEGHLRIEARVENGKVVEAWSSSTMFRGFEPIMQGRDPRDAWLIAQRVCGVCTTVHAISSVRAVENALNITIPDNARLLRNLLEATLYVQDHVVHFYHLHALDWVDVVSASQADPAATSNLAKSISDWPNSSPEYFAGVKQKVADIIASGQLGLFANGYWGHPAYKLPPEGNLLAVAHYLEALDWQREVMKFHALLGGKNPHPQAYAVGGMTVPVDPSSSAAINPTKINTLRTMLRSAADFVRRVYLPDLKLVGSFYKDWATLGQGPGNFLAFGDFPLDNTPGPGSYWMPQGIVMGKNLNGFQSLDQNLIQEYVAHSWYSYSSGDSAGKHPTAGETSINYTGPQPPYEYLTTDGKYSWLKAPRYNNAVMEVGPLARMVVAYAAGRQDVRDAINGVLAELGLGAEALYSTLGRVVARGVESLLIANRMESWLNELEKNMNSGNLAVANTTKWNPSTWPANMSGWGTTEAPRGALGHWVKVANGKITNYQMVVPSTWNGSPRDANGVPGAWEQALVGLPVADPNRPVEILRTIHSFDPCMACAVHIIDADGNEIGYGEMNTGIHVY